MQNVYAGQQLGPKGYRAGNSSETKRQVPTAEFSSAALPPPPQGPLQSGEPRAQPTTSGETKTSLPPSDFHWTAPKDYESFLDKRCQLPMSSSPRQEEPFHSPEKVILHTLEANGFTTTRENACSPVTVYELSRGADQLVLRRHDDRELNATETALDWERVTVMLIKDCQVLLSMSVTVNWDSDSFGFMDWTTGMDVICKHTSRDPVASQCAADFLQQVSRYDS